MSNYTKTTNFAAKDALTTGDANKIVKGTEINDEFAAIEVAIATKANSLSPTLTGTPLAPTATSGTNTTQIATTAFVTTADNAITAAYEAADDAIEARTISAGNGLTGGGDLSSSRTITMGAPSSLTSSTANGTTSTSHTHSLNINGFFNGSNASYTEDGYQILPGGLILQWGRHPLGASGGTDTVTLPMAFPNNVFIVFGGPSAINVGLDSSSNSAGKNGSSLSTILVTTDANGGGTTWFAIGN